MTVHAHDSFAQICDHLSATVDPKLFERMRWARDVGPRLAELVALALGAVEGRTDLELTEEQSTTDLKRYVLKVHGVRIIGLTFQIEDGQAHVLPVEIERSRYMLSAKAVLSVDVHDMNAEWMAGALKLAFSWIEPRDKPEAEGEAEVEAATAK